MSAFSFYLGLMLLLSMDALAGDEQTIACQWLEEWITTFAQIGFAIGAWLLYKAIGKQIAA